MWAIGDAAAVPDPAKRRRAPSPPTCQHAIRQGRRVAENVAATLRRRRARRPFRYRTLGVFVDMGRHKAVATMLGVRLRGFPAWFAARTYHLAMMPGVARKVRLGLDWTVGLFFGRASAELGQLGHPAALAEPAESAPTRERRSSFREGAPSDLRATFELSEAAWTPRALAARPAGARPPARAGRPGGAVAARAPAARVHRRPARRLLS